jgi:hypothetical protein
MTLGRERDALVRRRRDAEIRFEGTRRTRRASRRRRRQIEPGRCCPTSDVSVKPFGLKLKIKMKF